ncbi:MAG: PaaI family thioesterase [Deltaproteobacteria bacterium]|nr:PaaI family thioesterase [Deltaproteobacteria bacterium]
MSDHRTGQRRAYLQERQGRSRISGVLGFRLHYDEQGRAVMDLPYDPVITNGVDAVHGGIIGALIDAAGWYAAAQHFDTWVGTVEYKVHLLEGVTGSDLTAVARVVRHGKRLASTEVDVTMSNGRKVAVGSTTCVVTSRAYDGWPPAPGPSGTAGEG